jgi:protein-disulfide isomerase
VSYAGSVFRVLIICSCALTWSRPAHAQQRSNTSGADLAIIRKQLGALQTQQQLILDKLNDLESKMSADGVGGTGALPSTTEVRGERFKGESGAAVGIIEYSDYECPFCGQFEQSTFPQLLSNYVKTGKVKYIYRDLPLHHPHSMLAAQASHCAKDQGRYWEMHDALFANQANLAENHLSEIADSLNLDVAKFASCLASGKFTDEVQASVSEAAKLGINATPAFMIGILDKGGNTLNIDKRIVGAVPYEMLKDDLDMLLASLPQVKPTGDALMRHNFSRRAAFVVMEARRESGKRGASVVDLNSLIAGLIVEDQDQNSMNLNEQDPDVKRSREMEPRPTLFPLKSWIKREPFFPRELASNLLAKLEDILPKSRGVPDTTPIPTSLEFDRAVSVADNLRQEFHQDRVEPLHLLAAALREPCEGTKVLQEAGITEEKVLQTIRAGGDLERGTSAKTP